MKYKVTLNGKTYEVEVEVGKVVLLDEYEACAPAPAAASHAQTARLTAAAPARRAERPKGVSSSFRPRRQMPPPKWYSCWCRSQASA